MLIHLWRLLVKRRSLRMGNLCENKQKFYGWCNNNIRLVLLFIEKQYKGSNCSLIKVLQGYGRHCLWSCELSCNYLGYSVLSLLSSWFYNFYYSWLLLRVLIYVISQYQLFIITSFYGFKQQNVVITSRS